MDYSGMSMQLPWLLGRSADQLSTAASPELEILQLRKLIYSLAFHVSILGAPSSRAPPQHWAISPWGATSKGKYVFTLS